MEIANNNNIIISNNGRRGRDRSPAAASSCSSGFSSSRSPVRGSPVILVDRLSRNVGEEHLQEIFGWYGKIVSIIRSNGAYYYGSARVQFETAEEAEMAVKHMDRGQIDGCVVTVTNTVVAEEKEPPRRKTDHRGDHNRSDRSDHRDYRSGDRNEHHHHHHHQRYESRHRRSTSSSSFSSRSRSPPSRRRR